LRGLRRRFKEQGERRKNPWTFALVSNLCSYSELGLLDLMGYKCAISVMHLFPEFSYTPEKVSKL
jgi:hypothetical protein